MYILWWMFIANILVTHAVERGGAVEWYISAVG